MHIHNTQVTANAPKLSDYGLLQLPYTKEVDKNTQNRKNVKRQNSTNRSGNIT